MNWKERDEAAAAAKNETKQRNESENLYDDPLNGITLFQYDS